MRCLFFDCPVTVGLSYQPTKDTLTSALRAVGGNTGNLLFRYGISRSIEDELVSCHWSEGQDLAYQSHFDGVILGAANWLSIYHDNGNDKRASVLRALKKPTLCIGLGTQSPIRTSKKLNFPHATLDFIKVLREINAIVLVRDEFTYDQCLHHGLTNVEVIGCPSNFIDHSNAQEQTLLLKAASPDILKAVTLNHGYIRDDICKHDSYLLEVVKNGNGQYIVQDNLNGEIDAALSAGHPISLSLRDEIRAHFPSPLFSSESRIKHNLAKAGSKLNVYFNAVDWINSLRSSSLVLGTRIHGCIAALQSGVPSVITTIDSRTEGLAETLAVPRVKIEQLDPLHKPVEPNQIIDLAGLDFNAYKKRRSCLLGTYSKAISDFGLTLSSRLVSL